MTTPQTDAGRHVSESIGIGYADMWTTTDRDAFVASIEREATEHVLEVAARLLPPTDVSALRDALRENR